MTEKILVTGGTGFIGSYVVDRLVAEGKEVVVLARSASHPDPRPQVHTFLGDVRDATTVFEAMAHCTGFIHLAGVLGTQETIERPLPAVDTNIFGALNVLEAASRYKIPGVNIAVGNHWEANPYSITKSTAERFVHMYNKYRGTEVSIVRALNAYGPGQSVSAPFGTSQVRKIMPSFIMKALHGMPIQVYGTGNQIMDMVYVGDVARILVDTLKVTIEQGKALESVIEAGTGVSTSVREVALEVLRAVSGEYESHDPFAFPAPGMEFLPMRAGESASLPVLADTSTLAAIYGAYGSGFVPLRTGVRQTVEYYRSCLSK